MTHLDLSRPQLGVIDAADLAATLDLLGYGVTGGGDFRDAATSIRQHPAAATLPLIALDSARVGLRAWLTKQHAEGSRVVILRGDTAALPTDLGVSVQLPATVNAIMASAGWGPSPHPLGDAEVAADGSIAELRVYLPAPVVPTVEAAAPALAPAPAVTLAPAPEVASPETAPAPAMVSAPAPAIVEQAQPVSSDLPDWAREFTLPSTAAPSAPAPADVHEVPTPEPVAPSVDDVDDEDGWPELSAPMPMREHAAAAGRSESPILSWADDDPAQPEPAEVAPVAIPGPAPAAMPARALQLPDGPVSEHDFAELVEAARRNNIDEVLGASPQAPSPQPAPVLDDAVGALLDAEESALPDSDAPAPALDPAIAALLSSPVFDSVASTPEPLMAPAAPTAAPAPALPPVPVIAVVEPQPSTLPSVSAPAAELDPVDLFSRPVNTSAVPASPSTWPAPAVHPTSTPPSANAAAAQPSVPPTAASTPAPSSLASAAAAETWAPGQHALASVPAEDRARVLVTFAGKGGVGKTTTAILLAQRAAEAGMRVVIVDMNRGQGDVRSYLHLNSNQLRTVYNAAISGNPADAVIAPDELNAARAGNMQNLLFGLVLAPPPELADPEVVHAGVYGEVVAYLQRRVDLVVIDTQIAEARDTSGLIDKVVVPALSLGAFGFGLTDVSKPGMDNLLLRVRDFTTRGVPRSQLLLAVNKATGFNAKAQQAIEQAFGGLATFVGAIGDDSRLADGLNDGRVDTASKTAAPLIDRVLRTVTGRDVFGEQSRRRRSSLFGRRG